MRKETFHRKRDIHDIAKRIFLLFGILEQMRLLRKHIQKYYIFPKKQLPLLFPTKKEEDLFRTEFDVFSTQAHKQRFLLEWEDIYPCREKEITLEPHYTYHPAWAGRILAQTKPKKHIDISSTRNFVSLLSAFIPVDYYEFRPIELHLSNLVVKHADLTALPFADNSIGSLSCMHVIEHIGLGRYGDILDYDGDLKAIRELKRVTAPYGNLLIVVPLSDPPRIQFHAHRLYSYRQILEYFSPFDLIHFSLIKSNGQYIDHAEEADTDGCLFDCGCFWFRKGDRH